MKRIGVLGTFDVPNFGDLLFPSIAQQRLGRSHEVIALSPAGGPPIWGDCFPVSRLSAASGCDGLLIGGGNIIRMSAATLDAYQVDAAAMAGYSLLWAGQTNVAATGIPTCWNSPGVPEPFPDYQHPLVRSALDVASYVAVRDYGSRQLLLDVDPKAHVEVVPDTAWDVPSLWSADELDAAYSNVVAGRATPTIAIHLNERYLGAPEENVACHLDEIAAATDCTPLLLALGPCHADDRLAIRIARHMTTTPIVIDKPSSLREIVACIARSKAYIGSSMHGFITASAFGVPALNVATQKVVKFAGLQQLLGPRTICVETWSAAKEWAEADEDGCLGPHDLAMITQRLDEHWGQVAKAFASAEARPLLAVDCLGEKIFAATFQDLVGRFRKQQRRLASLKTK